MSNIIDKIEASQLRNDIPEFRVGDTVKVHVLIKEEKGQRVQIFEGDVIARKGSGLNETFTVRKISYGIGVERIFPVNSPIISKLEVVKKGMVRRAKLYFVRNMVGKYRIKERN